MVSTASIHVPPSMTIWSSAIGNPSAVKQGDRLFSWIDCRVLLVDVPVTEMLAALLREGMRATVLLDAADSISHEATVLQTRGASSRIGRSELAGTSPGHKNWTAQALVSIKAGDASLQCPSVGVRSSFPDIRLAEVSQGIYAWLVIYFCRRPWAQSVTRPLRWSQFDHDNLFAPALYLS